MDEYLVRSGLKSRSAVIRRALQLLRQPDLEGNYAAAWAEWAGSGEQEAWESTTADGVAGASRGGAPDRRGVRSRQRGEQATASRRGQQRPGERGGRAVGPRGGPRRSAHPQ